MGPYFCSAIGFDCESYAPSTFSSLLESVTSAASKLSVYWISCICRSASTSLFLSTSYSGLSFKDAFFFGEVYFLTDFGLFSSDFYLVDLADDSIVKFLLLPFDDILRFIFFTLGVLSASGLSPLLNSLSSGEFLVTILTGSLFISEFTLFVGLYSSAAGLVTVNYLVIGLGSSALCYLLKLVSIETPLSLMCSPISLLMFSYSCSTLPTLNLLIISFVPLISSNLLSLIVTRLIREDTERVRLRLGLKVNSFLLLTNSFSSVEMSRAFFSFCRYLA